MCVCVCVCIGARRCWRIKTIARRVYVYTRIYNHTHTHTQQVAAPLAKPDQGGWRRRQHSKQYARCSNTP